MHRPSQASREATLSSGKEAPLDDVVRCTQVDVRNSNKRRKQCPLGTATMATAGHGVSHDWEVGSSGMGCTSTTVQCQALGKDTYRSLQEAS
jgi:hypothetical protein